jgi:hypothetical protein
MRMKKTPLPLHAEELDVVQTPVSERKMFTVRLPPEELQAFKTFVLQASSEAGRQVSLNDAHRIAIRSYCGLTEPKRGKR